MIVIAEVREWISGLGGQAHRGDVESVPGLLAKAVRASVPAQPCAGLSPGQLSGLSPPPALLMSWGLREQGEGAVGGGGRREEDRQPSNSRGNQKVFTSLLLSMDHLPVHRDPTLQCSSCPSGGSCVNRRCRGALDVPEGKSSAAPRGRMGPLGPDLYPRGDPGSTAYLQGDPGRFHLSVPPLPRPQNAAAAP